MELVKCLAVLTFTTLVGYVNVSGQDVCVISERNVRGVKGTVAFVTAKNRVEASKVSLRKAKDRDVIIKEVETEKDGSFEMLGIRSGKYTLVVSNPNAVSLWVPIKLTKREQDKYLFITLGASIGEPCGGGEVKLINRAIVPPGT